MAKIETVTLFKGDERMIVNEADAAAWKKAGWKAKAPAKESD